MLRSACTLAVQLLPGVLLLLLGWGLNDAPGFFRNPARSGLVALALMAAAVATLLQLDVYPLRRGIAPVGNQSLHLAVLMLLSLALLWFLPFADRRGLLTFHHERWRYLGLLLCCMGVAVRIAALKALGKHFSAYVTLQPDHQLAEQGIYARIRHPLYLSLLLATSGVALVFASWLALPIFALAAAFVFDRIRSEERMLALHFGSEFEDYRRRTWKLVPFLF
jgi:protein-S-isoprenylcysteine O-methyltransferase Ste14